MLEWTNKYKIYRWIFEHIEELCDTERIIDIINIDIDGDVLIINCWKTTLQYSIDKLFLKLNS